jgi:hypothetical protein
VETTLIEHGGEKMKCDSCANQEICIHYATIQSFMSDTKYGLASLNPAIIVELVVKECPYYKKQKKKPEKPLTRLQDKLQFILEQISELEKEHPLVSKEELLQHLQKKRIPPEEGNRLISLLLREGAIYEPKDGYLKKT